jgi:hypothetical protein
MFNDLFHAGSIHAKFLKASAFFIPPNGGFFYLKKQAPFLRMEVFAYPAEIISPNITKPILG